MFNIYETFTLFKIYIAQRDTALSFFIYSGGVVIFINDIRAQLPEIEIVQLIPGLYLFVLFIGLVFLTYFAKFILNLTLFIDLRKSNGTKTLNRFQGMGIFKAGFILASLALYIMLNLVVPIGFDSLTLSGEKSVENAWTLSEIVGFELFLILVLVFISLIPIYLGNTYLTEEFALELPKYWKELSILSVAFAGIVTPTIDWYTQINFAGSTLIFYIVTIIFVQKRVRLKYISQSILGT